MKPTVPTRRDHALGAALAAAYVAVLLATAPAIGLSRDESTYVAAAESYAGWFELLAREPSAALDRAAIDRHWAANHEHPALVKSLFALSYLLDREISEATGGRGLFTRYSLPFRFPGMLSAGLLLWLLYVFGVRLCGRTAGLVAALAYALLPRPFYHAHLDAFDVPITLAVLAVTYAYYRALEPRATGALAPRKKPRRRWLLGLGIAFGLALSTKHNSWILPGIYLVHFAFVVLCDRVRARRLGSAPAFSPVPYWLLAMALIGPPLFIASWPWLWHDTLPRFQRYAAFHLHHDYYNIAYFGVNYFWPPFPISFPWVMTLYTLPVTTLLLGAIGLTPELRALLGRVRWLFDRRIEDTPGDPREPSLLLLGCLLAPLCVIAWPSTPIFGGTKHWFTAYPFLALFAGMGFSHALDAVRALRPALTTARWLPAALAGLLLLPAAVETAHSHPFGLSHYGFAAGFVPGAADRGMNRQFWGFTTGSLVDYFNRRLPNGGRVYVCDTTALAFRILARDGLLADNIVPTGDIAIADLAIVHHEHHFAEVDHQIWSVYGTTQPDHVLTYDGVPIISVYANPQRVGR